MVSCKQRFWWLRLLFFAVTVGLLVIVFRRLDLVLLAQVLRTMRGGWFVAALALYGLLFVPAAGRWHVVLRLTGGALPPAGTSPPTRIGHFFYTPPFGAAGG